MVDDGSTDRSITLLEELADQYPKMRLSRDRMGQNLGADIRLNALARAASQDWIAVLNSDDEFVPGRFEAIARAVQQNSAELIFGDLVVIDEEGTRRALRRAVVDNEFPWPEDFDAIAAADERRWAELLLQQNIIATTTNMVFSRTAFDRVGGFRAYRYCHDWDFALRIALTGTLRYAPLMLSRYRMHSGNTIRAKRSAIVSEVRRMFRGISDEFGPVKAKQSFAAAVSRNNYLHSKRQCWLEIICDTNIGYITAGAALAQDTGDVRLVSVPSTGRPKDIYFYAPGSGITSMTANDLRNLRLAVAVRGYDVLFISRSLEPPPAVSGNSARDMMIYSSRWAATDEQGKARARIIRLLPACQQAASLADFVNLDDFTIDHAIADTSTASVAWPDPLALPENGLSTRSGKPTVFVFPVFLAMGGAERLVIETMRHLIPSYDFVIITVEPLFPAHGSLHNQALQFAHVYDLAEIVRQEDRLIAIELLKREYAPSVVWICNGSPWQVAHASEIRDLFDDTPIIDNQVYDHERGWINAFGDPGVRAADRFIAINKRIQAEMQQRYEIPADRIDLVYHGANIAHLYDADPVSDPLVVRSRLGLPVTGRLFGMVGRLTPQKRPHDLIRLAAHSRNRGDNHIFVWAGPGELRAEMERLRDDLAADNFFILPPMSDVRPLYEVMDGLIITSEFEGLPFVMLEALALGVPVLSTPVGAIEEVLAEYGSGLISGQPGDLAALEAGFDLFIERLPALRLAAESSRTSFIEQFSSERMAREYEASWAKAIQARQSAFTA